MFYNKRNPKKVTLGDLVLHIKPFDCYQQIEYLELAGETLTDKKKLPELCIWCMNHLILDIENLVDDEGNAIDYKSFDKTELVSGLTIGNINAILDSVYSACKISDEHKKKS